MVWPHGDPAALSLIFPASPTSQTGASRRLQSTGNVVTGNPNSTQQMFNWNERQSTHADISNIFMWKRFAWQQVEQYSVEIVAFWCSSVIKFTKISAELETYNIKKHTVSLLLPELNWVFVNLDISCYKNWSSCKRAIPGLIYIKWFWHVQTVLVLVLVFLANVNINNDSLGIV